MTTNRTPIRRASRGALSSDQEQCLWFGCGRIGFPFEDEDECREAWERHKARIMQVHARNGRRPAHGGCTTPARARIRLRRERSTLFEAGLLERRRGGRLGRVLARASSSVPRARFRVLRRARAVSQGPRGAAGACRMGRYSAKPRQAVDPGAPGSDVHINLLGGALRIQTDAAIVPMKCAKCADSAMWPDGPG